MMEARSYGRGCWGSPHIGRRAWLKSGAAVLIAGLSPALRASPPQGEPLTPDDQKAVDAVRQRAAKAKLGPLEVRWTEHFVGVGDAPPQDYIVQALLRCEAFSKDFLDHLARQGFTLKYPPRRMVVVAMKDAASYQAYSGEERGVAVGGHYDLETNQLVVFDFRPEQGELATGARRVNTFTLIHETAHMLCYNTGLLPHGRDIPNAISEGLATYAELWMPPRPRERSAIGRLNHDRLKVFDRAGAEWIPIDRLLTDDDVFRDPDLVHAAYAESWLLVHHLMQRPGSLAKFRAYLAGFPPDDGKGDRRAYAASMLGSLRDLDAEVRRHARRLRPPRR